MILSSREVTGTGGEDHTVGIACLVLLLIGVILCVKTKKRSKSCYSDEEVKARLSELKGSLHFHNL